MPIEVHYHLALRSRRRSRDEQHLLPRDILLRHLAEQPPLDLHRGDHLHHGRADRRRAQR